MTPPADLESLKSQRVPSVTISTKATAPGVIVIGGGAAAAHGVEALREQGYKGRIQVFSSEKYLPIDRTKLSKGLMPVPDKILLRSAEFYEGLGVEFHVGTVRTSDLLLHVAKRKLLTLWYCYRRYRLSISKRTRLHSRVARLTSTRT